MVRRPQIRKTGLEGSSLGQMIELTVQKAMYGYIIEVESPVLTERGYLIFVPIDKMYAAKVVRTAGGQ